MILDILFIVVWGLIVFTVLGIIFKLIPILLLSLFILFIHEISGIPLGVVTGIGIAMMIFYLINAEIEKAKKSMDDFR
ncbi:unnamed protein product [marine sediment metagenome]|uniref:Uncharacterized protein n=1 Tax=marine sediment metagenome TaxID=412755 RepID=X1IJB7_9ZZZZ